MLMIRFARPIVRLVDVIACMGMMATSACTVGQQIPSGTVIDRIVVRKSERMLEAYSGGRVIVTYHVALGKNPVGAKHEAGDNKTPEGTYTINAKSATSKYHKNLGISYPNAADIGTAAQLGKSPGGDIKIHGLQNGLGFLGRWQTLRDWTAGCIAISNREIDDLYAHTPIGTPVEIDP
jgi:murein L,D-transpeptidase YafK